MGLYVYAVGKSGEGELPALQGILDRPAYRLDVGGLSAIVSECPLAKLRAERRHIQASQRVLSAVNARLDVLPMAFGTVTKSRDDLHRFLEENSDALLAQLDRICGAVEMGLRLRLEAADAVAYLVKQRPTLQAARDRLLARRRVPSHDEKIRLGQLVELELRQYRDGRTKEIMGMLAPTCTEIITLPVRDEREIANLAALIPRDGVDQFSACVERSAEKLEDGIIITVGGPWPPHNFVQFAPYAE